MDNGELLLYATLVLNARGNVHPEHTLGLVVSYVGLLGVSMCTSFDVPAAGIPVSCEWLYVAVLLISRFVRSYQACACIDYQ